jgi:ADP-ribose pyrophosphatase YjhB (NUDIX family)
MAGHLIQKCKSPIVSYGVIVYDMTRRKYLMICRSKSFGYIEFVSGEYSLHNVHQIQLLIDEMSIDEKNKILSNDDFYCIWNDIWCRKAIEEKSRQKFLALKRGVLVDGEFITLQSLIEKSTTNWLTPEWEFPKGRKNYKEKIIDCALREFSEETGYTPKDIKILENVSLFEEIFIGSNVKVYKHRYYLSILTGDTPANEFQHSEISLLDWKTYDECLESIRDYNVEKISIIQNVNSLVTKYNILI